MFLFPNGNRNYDEIFLCKGSRNPDSVKPIQNQWEILHLYAGILMFIAVILHLFSSKIWIVKVGTQDNKWLAYMAIGLGIAIILILALAPTTLVK